MATDAIDARAFVLANTVLEPVPFVDGILLHTATEIVPIWTATSAWLQSTGIEVPFWCVPWAGGQALARWLLDHPEVVRGKRVVDFGTGSGLVAIAAKRAGARTVRAVDIDPLAAAACALNAAANDAEIEVACEDVVDADLAADVAGEDDVWYELRPSARFAGWLRRLAARGVEVVTGDPGRAYVPSDARELAVYDVPTTVDLESSQVRRTRVLAIR